MSNLRSFRRGIVKHMYTLDWWKKYSPSERGWWNGHKPAEKVAKPKNNKKRK